MAEKVWFGLAIGASRRKGPQSLGVSGTFASAGAGMARYS
jgi:hypothetical protein